MSISSNLEKWGFGSTTPAYLMSRGPINLLQMANNSLPQKEQLLRAAMGNMWSYGRTLGKWSWLAGENPYAIKRERSNKWFGSRPTKGGTEFKVFRTETQIIKGWGLLAGDNKCSWSNCEGFNNALRVYAERILEIPGVEMASITENFITAPVGSGTIDKTYKPTVRTLRDTFDDTKLYFYETHAFLKFNNKYFDVTCAEVFDQDTLNVKRDASSDIKFCDLVRVQDPPTKKIKGERMRLYEVTNIDATLAAAAGLSDHGPKWLLELAPNPLSWSKWLLAQADDPANLSKVD